MTHSSTTSTFFTVPIFAISRHLTFSGCPQCDHPGLDISIKNLNYSQPQSDYFSQFCGSLVQCFTLLFPKSSKYLNYSHLFSLESIDIFWPVIIFELWKDWKKNVSEKLEIMMFKFYHFSPQALSTFLVLVSNYFICFSYWYVSRKWDDVLSSSWFFVVNLHLGKFGPPLGIGIS